jgi:DNA-binding phage protein
LGADLPSDKNLGGLDPLLEYAEEDANADEFEFQINNSWLQEFEESGAGEQIKAIVAEAVQPISQRLDALAKSAETAATNTPPQELEYMDWDDLVSWAIRLGVRQSGKAAADIAAAADITPERLDVILGKSGEATYEEIQKIVQALGLDLEYSEPSPRELAMRQREADLAKREADLRRQQVIEFTEPLIADGRVLPGDRAALESVILHLEASQPVEFAEEEETVSKPPAQVLRDWMSRLKPQIEFGEVVTGEDEENPGLDFQEAPGETVSPERLKLHRKAMSYKAKHNCDYSTAVKAVGGE